MEIKLIILLLFSSLFLNAQELKIIYTNGFLFPCPNFPSDYEFKLEYDTSYYRNIIVYSNQNQKFIPDSLGRFIFKPTNFTDSLILSAYRFQNNDSILVGQRILSFIDFPKPQPYFGGFKGGQIFIEDFLEYCCIRASLDNYDFNIDFTVISYSILVTRKDKLIYFEDCNDYELSSKLKKKLSKKLKLGDEVYFVNIKIKYYCYDSLILNSIRFKIKE